MKTYAILPIAAALLASPVFALNWNVLKDAPISSLNEDEVRAFRAVPLFCVQKSSVIVMLRRRGASQGRPVLGGSLKSSHATRSR